MDKNQDKKAVVTEIMGNKAKVTILRHEACSRCGGCLSAYSKKEMQTVAYNKIGAKVGDYVELTLKEDSFIKATLIVYGLPLVALILGLALGFLLKTNELISFGIGLLLMAVTFWGIRAYNKKLSEDNMYVPVISSYYYGDEE